MMPSPPAPATHPAPHHSGRRVAIIGAGPAGLMAAEVLTKGGIQVTVFDAMPSAARKFLMAGKGGMNLTHAEAYEVFVTRYAERQAWINPMLNAFGPDALRTWVHGLGVDTFVGTSGRVFPSEMKAAPMLRLWVQRLRAAGVVMRMRHKWRPFEQTLVDPDLTGQRLPMLTPEHSRQHEPAQLQLVFDAPDGKVSERFDAAVLALGGASWPRLGSDAAWVNGLRHAGVLVHDFLPANGGFETGWSEFFKTRFAGQPLKNVGLKLASTDTGAPDSPSRLGECMVTENGIEGGLIYAQSALIRQRIMTHGTAVVLLDLLPDHSLARVLDAVSRPRGKRSLSSHLQSTLGLTGIKAALLHECLTKDVIADPAQLGRAIKALPLTLLRCRPIAEAISSAGGVDVAAVDAQLMLHAAPGIFCAGEMLDWEAPTGGYLLTACFATGYAAGLGALTYLTGLSAEAATKK